MNRLYHFRRSKHLQDHSASTSPVPPSPAATASAEMTSSAADSGQPPVPASDMPQLSITDASGLQQPEQQQQEQQQEQKQPEQQQPQQPQPRQPSPSHKSFRAASRSPFRDFLRASTKRSRTSPPASPQLPPPQQQPPQPQQQPLPPSSSSTLSLLSIPTPAEASGMKPEQGNGAAAASNAGQQRKMPAFLALPDHAILQKFDDINRLENERLSKAANAGAPHHGRWKRDAAGRNRMLNRYADIQPWDSNRVRLRVPPGCTDYINASPIVLTTTAPAHAARPPDRYIAMQGPRANSVDHVWRMVYEQLRSPAVIVMLTETHERQVEKCYPYFPRQPLPPGAPPMRINERDEFGDGFLATLQCEALDLLMGGCIEQRKLVLRVHCKPRGGGGEAAPPASDGGGASLAESMPETSAGTAPDTAADSTNVYDKTEDERIVYHFLYKKWPDFGVPALQDLESFFALMRLSAEKNADVDNPRIVHCSAGVGRSGTFIALEHLLRELDAGVFDQYGAGDPDGSGAGMQRGRARPTAKSTSAPASAPSTPDSAGDDDTPIMVATSGPMPSTETPWMDWSPTRDEAATAAVEPTLSPMATPETDDLIYNTVNQLREQRCTMVQAKQQYLFIYRVMRKLWQDRYIVSRAQLPAAAAAATAAASSVAHDDSKMDEDSDSGGGTLLSSGDGSSGTTADSLNGKDVCGTKNGGDDDDDDDGADEGGLLQPAAKRQEVDPFVENV